MRQISGILLGEEHVERDIVFGRLVLAYRFVDEHAGDESIILALEIALRYRQEVMIGITDHRRPNCGHVRTTSFVEHPAPTHELRFRRELGHVGTTEHLVVQEVVIDMAAIIAERVTMLPRGTTILPDTYADILCFHSILLQKFDRSTADSVRITVLDPVDNVKNYISANRITT